MVPEKLGYCLDYYSDRFARVRRLNHDDVRLVTSNTPADCRLDYLSLSFDSIITEVASDWCFGGLRALLTKVDCCFQQLLHY